MGCKMKKSIKKISVVLLMLTLAMSLSAKAKKTITKKVKKNPNATEQKAQYSKAIVTLSPSAAEILYAIGAGDQIVAVSEFTDYPPEAAAKPVISPTTPPPRATMMSLLVMPLLQRKSYISAKFSMHFDCSPFGKA